ncbi:MAG TPA: patatin-like phospholipase family protein [Candidatus Dormibacteraeota bacterium]|nr:patatin-like phospholipase family protein [Candidatus Dormibacteraeota bacterium]
MSQLSQLPSTEEVARADPGRLGLSYAGSGPLLVVELGMAMAVIRRGIRPDAIAGVSSGSITGLAHVLDDEGGTGVQMAADVLGRQVNDGVLGLRWWQVLLHLGIGHWKSVGDNHPLAPILRAALRQRFSLDDPSLDDLPGPPLAIAAADRIIGEPCWFPEGTDVVDAIIASTAIPGLFPWVQMEVNGRSRILVDGGMVSNQPLSHLVRQGCGTILACDVGPAHPRQSAPTNLLDNALGSIALSLQRQQQLEADAVRERLEGRGSLHVIHADAGEAITSFDYTPAMVARLMARAEAQVTAQLDELGY